MSSSGVFLIGADSGQLIEGPVTEEKYYSFVGAYIDLIANTAAKAKIQPKIQLIATKGQPGNLTEIEEACNTILRKTKNHLEALDKKICLFLVDEVLVTSSEHVTRELMQRLSLTLSVLSTDEQLNEKREGRTPTEWFAVTAEMKGRVAVSLSEVAEIQKKMQEVASGTGNDETLKKFKALAEELKERFRAEPNPEYENEVESHADDRRKEQTTKGPKESETTVSDVHLPDLGGMKAAAPGASIEHQADPPKIEEVSTEVRTMLKYFCRKSDILWFDDVPELLDLVIPQPMAFVASLRSVISHDVCDKLREINGEEVKKEEKDIKHKGTMSYKTFVKIFNQSKELKFPQNRFGSS